MRATQIFPDLSVPDIAEARDFYADYLGLSDETINMDWVTRFQSPDGRAVVQLVTQAPPLHTTRRPRLPSVTGSMRLTRKRNDAATRSSIPSPPNPGA